MCSPTGVGELERRMASRSDLSHTISFRLLGPLEVMAVGKVLNLGGTRQHRALALLLLNNMHVVAVEQIVNTLWDEPPSSVRQQVHNAIASLRHLLSPFGNHVELHTAKAGYRISVPDEILDLAQFHARLVVARQAEVEGDVERAINEYESALELWRGPALPGLGGRHISGLAASLNEQRLDTIEHLLSLRLSLTEDRDLISEIVALLALHPGRESLRAKLMLALYRSGRQADALSVYEEGRRYLADELGVDPSPELRDTHLKMLRGSIPIDNVAAAKPSAPRPDRLCYLPHDVTEFIGRQAEISQVLAAMSDLPGQAVVISAIDGMGGIGKTALAVHLAHAVADRFPDGIFFVDLHGFTVGVDPLSSDQALDHLLRQAGVPIELVPKDSDIRSGYWRSHIASKRALIVLDNARNEAQVRPLLPGTGSAGVIVTSRRRLGALEGAHPITLDVLTMEDSLRLFTKIVDDGRPLLEPDATTEAINLCGRLPLAIRIAAARFRERKSWTVGHLIEHLDDQQRRSKFLTIGDRSVAAVIAVSYRYLSEAQPPY
ncbi:MAG TPA: AfsR family transcriptional regulator [Micromonosporaceae bacterium]|nr:AfsR family transcriptional regulator [Micromonosporaceae bacterium]